MTKKAREQVAALPVAPGEDGRPRVMLLTSRGTRRWVIPKGWPIPGLTPQDAAAREAYEEAGLVGAVVHECPVGAYSYEKRLGSGRTVTCRVAVYLFRVDRQLREWPEKAQRRTRWFAPAEAAALVAEAELAALLRDVGTWRNRGVGGRAPALGSAGQHRRGRHAMDQHQQHQQPHAPEQHYAGLDVSLDDTSVCVLDAKGAVVWRGKCASTPEAIRDALRKHAPALVRVGLETGLLSNWLTHRLRGMRLPVVCLDARHAKAALKMQINKTDANDALGLAQIVRTGWYREVAVKSVDAHTLRLLLVARSQLVSQRQAIANTVRGLLKAFGLKVVAGSKGPFAARVREVAEGNDALLAVVDPMLLAWQALREQVAVLDRRLVARAKADETAKRLMTVPGVGVVVSLAYTAVIDDPTRFKRSSSVGAYLGLTPRRQQSGEMDRMGRISKCGDGLLRAYLFEAANVLLTRHPKSCALKEWGLALARRSGLRRAKVAVARKLAVVMHCIWKSGQNFRWPEPPASAAPEATAA